jgi:hypothetical protein
MVYGAKITVVRRNIAKLPDRRPAMRIVNRVATDAPLRQPRPIRTGSACQIGKCVSSTQRRRHARYTGSKARIGGKLPLKRSTSTVVS